MDLSVFLPHTEEVSAQLPPARLCKFDPVNVAANVFDSEAMGREMCHPSSSPQIPSAAAARPPDALHPHGKTTAGLLHKLGVALALSASPVPERQPRNLFKDIGWFPCFAEVLRGLSRSVARNVAPWHSWFQVGRRLRQAHLSKSAD